MDKTKFFEYCFGCAPDNLPEKVIVTPFLSVKKFAEHCEAFDPFKGKLYSGAVCSKNGREFGIIRCGMGDRLMGDAVLLMDVTPVKSILFTGACGGLKDCHIGDLVVCESAFDGEGFCRYHAQLFDMKRVFDTGELKPADFEYTKELTEFLSEKIREKENLKIGDIFTIGSLVAEQEENILAIAEKGFRGIDLELSAVYHAARVTGRKVAGLVFVSDLPFKLPIWANPAVKAKEGFDRGAEELVRFSVGFISL